MNNYTTKVTAVLLALAVVLPTATSAQLSSVERRRAEEVARIQAKADAEERAKERRVHLDGAKAVCSSSGRQWDYAAQACKPK